MHIEIQEIMRNAHPQLPIPNMHVLGNADILLNYFDDINVQRKSRFEKTAAESLYILWEVENLECHIECLPTGEILYTFRKDGIGKAHGRRRIIEFIIQMEQYLLMSIN